MKSSALHYTVTVHTYKCRSHLSPTANSANSLFFTCLLRIFDTYIRWTPYSNCNNGSLSIFLSPKPQWSTLYCRLCRLLAEMTRGILRQVYYTVLHILCSVISVLATFFTDYLADFWSEWWVPSWWRYMAGHCYGQKVMMMLFCYDLCVFCGLWRSCKTFAHTVGAWKISRIDVM